MADPCDAGILLVSVKKGAKFLGVPVAYSFEFAVEEVVIRGEGKTGPSCRGNVATDFVLVVDFLVEPPIDPIGDTPETVVIVVQDSDLALHTKTITSMKALGFANQLDREAPPERWRQRYAHKGDMDATPLALT